MRSFKKVRAGYYLSTLFLCVVLSFTSIAQTIYLPSDTIPTSKAIRSGTLGNGFKYYLLKKSTETKEINVTFVTIVGAYNESDTELGTAHLIEHLYLRSTTHFPKGVGKFMESRGLQSKITAFTRGDFTDYSVTIPSGDADLLRYCLLSALDCAKGRLYLPSEVEEERSAVLKEIAMADTRSMLSLKQKCYLQLDKAPLYAPKLAEEQKCVKNVSIEALRKFDSIWYQPYRQAIIIVGDIDELTVENQVKELFNPLSKAENVNSLIPPVQHAYKNYDVPLSGKDKLILVNHDADQPLIYIDIYKKRKTISTRGGSFTIAQLRIKLIDHLYNILSRQRMERLSLAGESGLSDVTYLSERLAIHELAGIDALGTHMTVTEVSGMRDKLISALTEWRRIEKWGFTQAEFSRAKEEMKATINKYWGEPRQLHSLANLIESHFVYGAPIPKNSIEISSQILESVALGEINKMAQKWLGESGNTDYVFSVPNDLDKNLPTEEEVLLLAKEISKKNVGKYHEIASAELPKIRSRKHSPNYEIEQLEQIGATRLKLSNGVQIIFKPIDVKNGPISVSGFRNNSGSNNFPQNISSLAFNKLTEVMGVSSVDNKALKEWKWNRNRNGYLDCELGLHKSALEIKALTSHNNYESLLQLIYWYSIHPTIDMDVVRKSIESEEKKYSIKKSGLERLEDTIRSIINTNAYLNEKATLTESQYRSAFQHLKKEVSFFSNFTFIVAGSFNEAEIRDLTAKYLGALPENLSNKSKIKKDISLGDSVIKRYDNQTIKIIGDSIGNTYVRLLFPIYAPLNEKTKFQLQLVKRLLEPLLFNRLREREKGVYAVHPRITRGSEAYFLDIDFEAHPSDIDRLVSAVREEVSSLSGSGLNQILFDNSKEAILKEKQNEFKNSNNWVIHLENQLKKGEPLNMLSSDKLLNEITLAELKRSVTAMLDPNNFLLFMLL